MISPDSFVRHLGGLGVSMFVGVPDSLLKPFGQFVMSELPPENHIITSDEGAAVGFALGYYLRTQTPALVYMQNSGFGNAINPLLSLADPDVYGVPMVLLVGWRGQPGVSDEPQHVKQGRVMTELLDAMQLPYSILPRDEDDALRTMSEAVESAIQSSGPHVVLVEKGTFSTEGDSETPVDATLPSREEALEVLTGQTASDAVIVSTTGMLSRELFELRERQGADGARDFLTVGGMGHASAIAFGIAHADHEHEVWCFDGDGALLMHAGTLANIAEHGSERFFHVVFNNGVHDSVGGQPTSIGVVDVAGVARAFGYQAAQRADSLTDIPGRVAELREVGGPALLEIMVRPGARADLGRPTRTPRESRDRFIDAVTP